jgi:hypothetical protein
MNKHLSWISTPGHGYLAVRGDKANALACSTGYDYESRHDTDLVLLEEDISAGIYLAKFTTEEERGEIVTYHRNGMPNGLRSIPAGSIGAEYLKGKGW